MTDADRYLAALFGDAGHDTFVELRFRTHSGMGRAFYAADRLSSAAEFISQLASTTDVYVGVLPRRRQASHRDDVIAEASVLWADCDSPESVAALNGLAASPSLVIASGTADNRHAYWRLRRPVPVDVIERANRSLASCLGADISSTDAARVLRPPVRAANHKHDPPGDVRLLRCDDRCVTASTNSSVRNRRPSRYQQCRAHARVTLMTRYYASHPPCTSND